MNNTYQYFISKNHIIPQCKKLLSIIKQPTTEEYMSLCYQELKKKDIELFNLYYHRKPNNISEKDFITKLSHKAVLDSVQLIYNKIKLLNNPYNPTPNIQHQNNFNSLLPPRVGQLQPPTNNIQPQSYSEIYNQYTGGVKPNEVEVMNQLKHMGPQEDYVKKGYLNNNNSNNRQLQQLQQQVNQPQQYQQPNQQYQQPNQQYNQYQQQYQQPQQYNQQPQQQFNQYQQPQQYNQSQKQQQQLPQQLQPINTLQLNQQNPVKIGEYKYNPTVPIPQNMQMVGLLANDPNLEQMIQGQGSHAQISNEIAGKTNFIPGLDDYNQNKALMDKAMQDPKRSMNDLSHLENF